MEPAAIIEGEHDTDATNLAHCFFCQNTSSKKILRVATLEGKVKAWTVANQRRELQDEKWHSVLERMNAFSENEFVQECVNWHKECYATFTSKLKLTQLRKRSMGREPQPSTSGLSPPKRRSSSQRIDWNTCIFCQIESPIKLRAVAFLDTSRKMLELSQHDRTMRTRLAGINDLIAADALYHLECWVTFQRRYSKSKLHDQEEDETLGNVCIDLINGLARGHVYEMASVWSKYKEMCEFSGLSIPQSYLSRRATFYERVKSIVGSKARYVRPLSYSSLLVYPSEKTEAIIADSLEKSIDEAGFSPRDEMYVEPIKEQSFHQQMVHVALKIRTDLKDTPGHLHSWQGLDQDHVEKVIPESLYLFLRLLFSGDDAIENEESLQTKIKVCSIAQDIVYALSDGRKLTPKHIGLGMALHQATRSESLVNLFHAANHTIGIDTLRRMDTSIAQSILDKFMKNGYIYIPDRIVSGTFLHCSFDNIDVLEETIDGKNTFHCTQMMVWQRQTSASEPLQPQAGKHTRAKSIQPSDLEKFQAMSKSPVRKGKKTMPLFQKGTAMIPEDWMKSNDASRFAEGKDFAWLVSRSCNGDQDVPGWKTFNMKQETSHPQLTTAGMLPILQANADSYDTITTVIERFCSISKFLGQTYTVITADQPLYSKGKEITWAGPDKYSNVIFLMGGFHITCNFLRTIGQHMENAGLEDLWTESGVYAANSIDAMLEGKAYYRAVRAHLLTYEALWRIRWEMMKTWAQNKGMQLPDVECHGKNIALSFSKSKEDEFLATESSVIEDMFQSPVFQDFIGEFKKANTNNSNFMLWSSYMDMVVTLLNFIRAEREGNWELHLEAFASMLPWITVYDHHNYARWGPVYLTEMRNLATTAPDVYSEFVAGNFVIRKTPGSFNQVSADHATEWMNKMCKMHNGIIGITRNDQARDKFCITWSQRSTVSQDTRRLFRLEGDEDTEYLSPSRHDGRPVRIKRDSEDVDKIMLFLKQFDVFRSSSSGSDTDEAETNNSNTPLLSLATKDIATDEIARDMLTARERGSAAVTEFFEKRLITRETGFFDTLKKMGSKTFAHLYKSTVATKNNVQKEIKADRSLIQRLLNAVNSGRHIDMLDVLSHELSPLPQSLCMTSGRMRSTSKSELAHILLAEVTVPAELPDSNVDSCYIIDGHALIQAIQKPKGCKTFGEWSRIFCSAVLANFRDNVSRIDVVFDRYAGKASIKAFTREKRTSKRRPIRKYIDGPHVPLPESWKQFLALDENKEDLARFLSEQLSQQRLADNKKLVISGGFRDALKAWSSMGNADSLAANHEEADTRIILHANNAVETGYQRVIVASSDTDVMVLLLHFIAARVSQVWMEAGVAREKQYYPLHEIVKTMTPQALLNLPSFHSFTGCDTTSSFFGYGKKSCWEIYKHHCELLNGVGRDGHFSDAEKFVLRLYRKPDAVGVNEARLALFTKAKKQLEKLPPTRDALELHLIRANYQAKIWLQATKQNVDIEDPTETGGWEIESHTQELQIVWTRQPSISQSTMEIATCGCRTKCGTSRCTCFKSGLPCITACGCDALNCCNPAGAAD